MNETLLISVEQAAKMLGISRAHLFRLINDGVIHPIRLGGRTLFYPPALRAFVEKAAQAACTPPKVTRRRRGILRAA